MTADEGDVRRRVAFQVERSKPLSHAERRGLALFAAQREKTSRFSRDRFHLDMTRDPLAVGIVAHGALRVSNDPAHGEEEVMRAHLDSIRQISGARVLVSDDRGALGSDTLRDPGEAAHFAPAQEFMDELPVKRRNASRRPTGDELRALGQAVFTRMGPEDPKVAAHVGRFLEYWRHTGGRHYLADLVSNAGRNLVAAVARHPDGEAAMCQALAEVDPARANEAAVLRAGAAAYVLGWGRSAHSLAALLSVLRRARATKPPWAYSLEVVTAVRTALCHRSDPRSFAAVALALSCVGDRSSSSPDLALALADLDPARAEPLLVRMVDRFPRAVAEGLGLGSSPEGARRLEELLFDLRPEVREAAARALGRRRGEEVPVPVVPWDPYEHLTHARPDVRVAAIDDVAQRRLPQDRLAVVAATALSVALGARPLVPVTDWSDIPERVKVHSVGAVLKWMMKHRDALGEQRVPEHVRPILERGVAEVAADYRPRGPLLSAEEQAEYEREDAEVASWLA